MSDGGQIDPAILADLAASGLQPEDMRIRELGSAERQTTGTPLNVKGYVIPYFNIKEEPIKFYRVKLIDWEPKYRQLAGEPNHLYFPKGFVHALNNSRAILLVEGEKKATCAVKHGYPAIGVSGVDSWRNRTVKLPKMSEMGMDGKENIVAKLPSGAEATEHTSSLATGMFDLINLALALMKPIVILFDSEKGGYQKREVQAAAAQLGYELRFRGLPMGLIRSFILHAPSNSSLDKVGLDDFLESKEALHGPDAFEEQLDRCLSRLSAFPLHPNPREFVNKKLQAGRMNRRDMQTLSTSILSDLDAKGVRLNSPDDDQLYYFSRVSKELTPVSFRVDHGYARSPFGVKMYRDYNISAGDKNLLEWLSTQYTGEQPIITVRPRKVLYLKEDQLYYQLNDSTMVRVTGHAIEFLDNGQHDILFESGAVVGLKEEDLKKALTHRAAMNNRNGGIQNMWYEVIKEARVKESTDDRDRKLMSLLYSISPWFYRWRGTQLPAEMTVGEQGSGKSSLYILRLNILEGKASLKNSPHDIKDWGASVASTAGLHVTDNVHTFNHGLRQELSDELAQPLDAKVLTPTGYRTMGEIRVGDCILDPWGRKVKVIAEHPHGLKEVYKVTLGNGQSTECCLAHNWQVHSRDDLHPNHPGRTMQLKDIVAAGLHYEGKNKFARWYLPPLKNNNIDLTSDDLDYSHNIFTPYNMGLMLGDGHFGNKQLFLAGGDTDCIKRFEDELPNGVFLGNSQEYSYYLHGPEALRIRMGVIALGLNGTKAATKFIPDSYLYSTASQRLELLRGLMDSDGTIHVNQGVFSTISKQLAEGVQFIVQSLGGKSTVSQRADGAYQVSVSLAGNINPFWGKRKASRYEECNTKPKKGYTSIQKVELIGLKEVKCISLETPEGLYMTNDWIITHNCRVITEPDPCIEKRMLYSDFKLAKIPVQTVFAVTALSQPFTNADIIARSIIIELDKGQEEATFDDHWCDRQLARFGGREGWLANQFIFQQQMFKRIRESWEQNYRAKYRLVNVEQLLIFAAEIYGMDSSWIPQYLEGIVKVRTAAGDETLAGLNQFVEEYRTGEPFTCKDIAEWARDEEDFKKRVVLTNSRKLGHYLAKNANKVANTTGIVPWDVRANVQRFSVDYAKRDKMQKAEEDFKSI